MPEVAAFSTNNVNVDGAPIHVDERKIKTKITLSTLSLLAPEGDDFKLPPFLIHTTSNFWSTTLFFRRNGKTIPSSRRSVIVRG